MNAPGSALYAIRSARSAYATSPEAKNISEAEFNVSTTVQVSVPSSHNIIHQKKEKEEITRQHNSSVYEEARSEVDVRKHTRVPLSGANPESVSSPVITPVA